MAKQCINEILLSIFQYQYHSRPGYIFCDAKLLGFTFLLVLINLCEVMQQQYLSNLSECGL